MARVITLFGCDHRSGVSLLSAACARELSRALGTSEVLLISSGTGPGGESDKAGGASLEKLLGSIHSGQYDVDEIKDRSFVSRGFHVIEGFFAPGSASYCQPEAMASFVRSLGGAFDVIVCDGGSRIEEGAALGCLLASDVRCIAAEQSERWLKRYQWLRPYHAMLGIGPQIMAVNFYSSSGFYSKGDLSSKTGISDENIFTVKYREILSGMDVGHDTDEIKDGSFYKDVGRLARALHEVSERRDR
ncbi:MAG: hypothetical protein II974_03695 [Firmicutes bacterium]|nr:hypothetical protein [Bacillota bacterium]